MKSRTILRSGLVLAIILLIMSFIKLPFYITQPGMASELEPIIKVENGFDDEKGSFSLTTVRFGRANPLTYVWAKVNEFYYIHPLDDIKREDESDKDYMNRQLHMMEVSQEAAISVAYEKANKKVEYTFHGIYVDGVIKNMPAASKLEVGDRIYKVDSLEFQTAEEFIEYVAKKKEGEEVIITFEREGKRDEAKITLSPFPNQPEKIGLGISLVTDRQMDVEPEIELQTEEIGGPSAGLMMSLEIYNQLTEGDLTKGYQIAGTGTINAEGVIGPIGGISQKIVAADKEGIDIFFAPNEKGDQASNYNEAVETGKKIGTDMEIIPVDTFDEAIEYLNNLEQKSA
ncbi:SepM family pheromone-processing serine protease [Metabacillus halosaccharovorans]|uniref:SepM family pheromone-processing serine protease n=1 Tax=Metabacillus halosaccharovorans TaxID=930124 RepID=UPI001C1F59C5|nr:SepM family pheromone-processing serine protease [Metabacillus halosaccharovorans]MBU7592000.1 PDZ domain-containing protein [Metabacillus halosaccharovorans]